MSGNAEQIEIWNAASGKTWVREADHLERMMREVSAAILAAAAPAPGEHVIDIGCGAGALSLALADAVGPQGAVLGVDVSAPLLDLARRRASGRANVSFAESDASSHAFAPASADLLFSKFGVMFFSDPEGAFRNMRAALKPAGRLAFACWRTMRENPFATVPLAVALKHVPAPPPGEPLAPGPFAFADAERVRAFLGRAGFSGVMIAALDVDMLLGTSPADAAQRSRTVGPAARLLAGQSDEVQTRIVADLETVWAAHATASGVIVPARCWIVTARAEQ